MKPGQKAVSILPKPYFFSGFLCLLTLIVGAFFLNEVSFFNENFELSKMNDVEFLVTFVVFILLFVGYFLFAKTRFHYKEPIWIDIILLGVLITGFLGIWLFPEETPVGEVVYVVTLGERIRDLLSMGVSTLLVYVVFVIGPRTTKGKQFSLVIAIFLVLLALSACVYSLIVEFDIISHFFRNDGSITGQVIQSYTNNRNTFGTLLLFALGATAILNTHRPNILYSLLFLVFCFFLFLTLSKTSLVLGAGFMGVYGLYRFFFTFPRHKFRNTLVLMVCILFVAAVLIMNFTSWLDFLGNIAAGTKNVFVNLTKFGSFQSRIDTWEVCFAALDTPSKLLLGMGYRNINYYVYALNFQALGHTFPTHNGLVDLFCRSGIVGASFFLVLLFYYFTCLALSIKKENHLSITYLLITFVFLFHAMTETTDFFLMDAKALGLALMVLFPVISMRYRDKTGIAVEERDFLMSSPSKLPKVRYEIPAWRKMGIALFILAPFVFAFSCSGAAFGFYYDASLLLNRGFYLSVTLNYFLLPYAFYCGTFLRKNRGLYFTLLILFFLASIIPTIFMDGNLSILVSLLALPLPVFGGCFTRNARRGRHPNLFSHTFAPYLIPFIVSNLLCHILDGRMDALVSRYLCLLFALLGLFSLLLSLSLGAVHRHCLYPISHQADCAEMRVSLLVFKLSTKARNARYLSVLPPRIAKEEKAKIKAMQRQKAH